MNETILLYWFPIVLTVGLAAGLLGRKRALPLTVAGALYWIVLVMVADRNAEFAGAMELVGLLLGAVVIAVMGMWMADPQWRHRKRERNETGNSKATTSSDQFSSAMGEVIVQFDDWLAENIHRTDPWPDFGEFVRSTLSSVCDARHIRAYRVLATDDDQIYPLRRTEPDESDFPTTRGGLIGHVVTSGKSYYAGDPSQGDLVKKLSEEHDSPNGGCAWCFAVKKQRRPVGVVVVGEMDSLPTTDTSRLHLLEGIVALCWSALAETCQSRVAGFTDPVSGALTQDAFVTDGERSLRASYAQGEPVALINIGIEGLRTLYDNAQWDVAHQAMFEISSVLKQRIRQDDEIGVFDGSRFLLLLRRVDSELATLIVEQLMEKLSGICGDQRRWGLALSARCGVAGSGISQPSLRTLISRSTAQCTEARKLGVPIVSDLTPAQEEACQT